MTYQSRLTISASARDAALPLLQARLADAIHLERQSKQAHWNVKGREFLQLHQLFDQIHAVVEEFGDTIAERIVTLGGTADGRVDTVARSSQLAPYPIDARDGASHLDAIAAALAKFGALVRQDIDTAAAAGEQDTADIFTGISRETDKQLWFVEAHLVTPTQERAT